MKECHAWWNSGICLHINVSLIKDEWEILIFLPKTSYFQLFFFLFNWLADLICRDNKEIDRSQEYHCVNWTWPYVIVGSLWITSTVQFKETGFLLLITSTKFSQKVSDEHQFLLLSPKHFLRSNFLKCELRQKFGPDRFSRFEVYLTVTDWYLIQTGKPNHPIWILGTAYSKMQKFKKWLKTSKFPLVESMKNLFIR